MEKEKYIKVNKEIFDSLNSMKCLGENYSIVIKRLIEKYRN